MREILGMLLIPLAGTVLGASLVFFSKKGLKDGATCILSGFSAGVMVAASLFGLMLPAIESASEYGRLAALPSLLGMGIGFALLLLCDGVAVRLEKANRREGAAEDTLGGKEKKRRVFLTAFAVTLHNLPEGMAVGAVLVSLLQDEGYWTAALTLALGIAVQNIPEGAIVSLPLQEGGMEKKKAFAIGLLSGLVEPLGALLPLLAAAWVLPLLPYFLGFAAGAMLSVAVKELLPSFGTPREETWGTVAFAIGFAFMTFLDVALG